jgi:hypothetical protein
LCWLCHQDLRIRGMYAPLRERAPKPAIADRCGTQPEPPPTDAPPGSEEKIAELCRRAERGQALFRRDERTRFVRATAARSDEKHIPQERRNLGKITAGG